MKKDFDDKIKQCYDAINTSSIMHGALVNVLIEKNIFERNQLLQEVQKLSTDLNDMVEKIEKEKQQNMSPEKKEEEQKVYKE
jgi:hypothetical protein